MLKYYRLVSLLSIFVLVLSCSNAPSSSSSSSSSSSFSSSSSSSVNPATAFYGKWYCYKIEMSTNIINYSLSNSFNLYNFKSDGTADRGIASNPTMSVVTWSVSGNQITIGSTTYTYSFLDSNHFYYYIVPPTPKYYYKRY